MRSRRAVAIFSGAFAFALGAAIPTEAQRSPLDSAARSTWAALLAVHDARSADTAVIDRALASPVASLRAAAARVVGTNRIAARYPVLRVRLARERDSAAARDAAFALGLAADRGSCDVLRAALESPITGAAAAWALGELNDECGGFDVVYAGAAHASARAALLRAAGKWTPFPDSVVVRAFGASAPAVRWASLYALARARRPAGAALAVGAARSPDPALRELAARLMTSTLQPPADSSRVVATLETLLGDRAPHVRIAAVRSLATYRSLAGEALTAAWVRERDMNVRLTMAQSVGAVADTTALWRRWWSADTTSLLRRALIASAWQAGAIHVLDDGPTSLDSAPDARIRIAMVEGAAAANVDRNAGRIIARLGDPDPRVRAVVVRVLGRISVSMRDSLRWSDRLDEATRDPDEGVRAAALAARRRGEPTAPPTTVALRVDTAETYARVVREVIVPSLAGRPPGLLIETERGPIRIVLDGVSAAMTTDHLLRLARAGYFRDLRFHRVVPAFVAQGGDPRGDGSGGPGFAIRDELNRSPYVRGAVGMALSGPDTGGSQFFLTLAPQPHLDGHYTVFGRVISGATAMDALVQGDQMRNILPLPR